MTLGEYCEYIKSPLTVPRARVLLMPSGENWTALRLFCQGRGDVELRMSDFMQEDAWLPMPDEILERVRDATLAQTAIGKAVVVLGVPGYLALLTDENKRSVAIALREWVDGDSGLGATCFLQNDESTKSILRGVFTNPRYQERKQLVEIKPEKGVTPFSEKRTELMLVGKNLAQFIPEACDTFQKYLRFTENHPCDDTTKRIVVASEGRELAGLSAEVEQIVYLRDLARVFYAVDDAGLSDDALRWICGRGKESTDRTLVEILKALFFPDGELTKLVLREFDKRKGVEREALLWLVKQATPKRSYLERVLNQDEVSVVTFRSAYVTSALQWMDDTALWDLERKTAIISAELTMSDADIRRFIASCLSESTARVAPWLNCGTSAERAELLRRCSEDGLVSNAVKEVYSETAAYLNADFTLGEVSLDEYFLEYRELKMVGRVTPEFYARAGSQAAASSVQSRDTIVQRYALDSECALLVVDAMGAEWLPMLVTLARERNLGLDSLAVGMARLPTSTQFNNIFWTAEARRLPDIKRLDNIAHNGAEAHETRRSEENLASALEVIGSEVLPRIADGLAHFQRVLVTADHGSSRLAALAWQSKPRLAQTLPCEEGTEVADWRYRDRPAQGECPPELEETLDGKHWVVRGYNRLPKKGGGQGFELHGGATLEERLVPVVVFSRSGQFVPKSVSDGTRAQFVEKDDFDL